MQRHILLFVSSLLLLFPILTMAWEQYSFPQESPYKRILELAKNAQDTKPVPQPSPSQPLLTKTKTKDQIPNKSKQYDVETWTLILTSSLSSNWVVPSGTVSGTHTISGTAILKIDKSGRLTGSGTMSVVYTNSSGESTAKATGQGQFTVTGKRDGQYLIFSFDRGNIPLKGTMTIPEPNGTKTIPWVLSFDPSTPAPTPTAIDRKDGGTSTSQIKAGPVTGTTTFSLSGGANVAKESPPPKGTFPKETNIWTLEYQFKGDWVINTPEVSGSGQQQLESKLDFPLPLEDGPAKGEAPMTGKSSTKWTKPKPLSGSSSEKGVLILDGNIKKGVLTFKPRAKLESVQVSGSQQTPAASASGNLGEGLWIFDQTAQVSIPVKNGAEVVENISPQMPNAKFNGKAVWRLKGKKVEHWLATIDQWNTIVFGDSKPRGGQTAIAGRSAQLVVAGLKVHSRRIIDFIIENDRYKTGKGTTSLVSIEPYSNPAGVYKCKPIANTLIGTGTEIEAERWDQVRHAKRFNPKFMTKEDAELKKKWEKIDQHETPYVFPSDYAVDGIKTGLQVKLTLPDGSGYTVAHHCILDENEAMKKVDDWKNRVYKREEVAANGYQFKISVEVTLLDGWSSNRKFVTKTDVETWSEIAPEDNPDWGFINTENREAISVKRIK